MQNKQSSSRSRSRSRSVKKKDRKRSDSRSSSKQSASKSRNRSRSRSRNRKSASCENKGNVLYVTNFSMRTEEKQLEDKFKKFGPIEDVEIVKDPYTKESRGFAFIYFKYSKDSEQALNEVHNTEFGGKTLRVERAKRGKAREKTPGQYLGHYKARARRSDSHYRDSRRRRSRGRRSSSRSYSRRRSRSHSRSRRSRSRSRSRSNRRRR